MDLTTKQYEQTADLGEAIDLDMKSIWQTFAIAWIMSSSSDGVKFAQLRKYQKSIGQTPMKLTTFMRQFDCDIEKVVEFVFNPKVDMENISKVFAIAYAMS